MRVDRVNLLPKPPSKLKTINPVVFGSVLYGLMLIGLSSATYLTYRDSRDIQVNVSQASSHLRSLKGQTTVLQAQTSKEAEAQTLDLEKLKVLAQKDAVLSDILKELSLISSDDVWLISLTIKDAEKGERNMTIIGETADQAKISEFFQAMERSYYLRNVHLKSSERLAGSRPALFRFQFFIRVPVLKYALGEHL